MDYASQRQPDPPLTETGREQARRLAGWLKDASGELRPTRLASSLTTRAVQTAAPLALALDLEVHGLAEAHKCGGLNSGPAGNFEPVTGRDHTSLMSDCSRLRWPDDLHAQPWDGGYEPWEPFRFRQRAARVAAELRSRGGDASVVDLITHFAFAQFLMAELLGLPALDDDTLRFRLDNTSTTLLELWRGDDGTETRVLHWLNRTDHLTPELVTI